MPEKDSILQSIKKLLGIDASYDVFDTDIIISINSVFMVLNQLGVGPSKCVNITGVDETWADFTQSILDVAAVRSYVYLRVKVLFDPPTSGVLHEAMERQISEYEWRLLIQAQNLPVEEIPSPSEPSGGADDHIALTHRDAPDSHPIEAITGLDEKVDSIPRAMNKDELNTILHVAKEDVSNARRSISK